MVLNNTVYAENENIIRLKNRNKDSGEAEWAMNLGKKSGKVFTGAPAVARGSKNK